MFEEKLINEVQKFACIYDKTHVGYRNKLIKEKAWSVIASAVGRTKEQCCGRWKTLRERYVKEFYKCASGSAAVEYKPKWQYTEAMSFMKDYVKPKSTNNNFVDDLDNVSEERQSGDIDYDDFCQLIENDSSNLEDFNASACKEPTTQSVTKKRKQDLHSETYSQFTELIGTINTMVEKKLGGETKNESFYKFVDSLLCKVDDNYQDIIKVEVVKFVSELVNKYVNEKKT